MRRSLPAFPVVFALLFITGCASGKFQMLTKVEEHYPSASQCGKCHVDIYEEWKKSEHSTSYANDAYRFATNEHSFQDCLGCHAPTFIQGSGVPTPRTAIRDEGVTCVSCHFKQGTLTGPIETTAAVVPHAVDIKNEFFKTSALCGTCHQGTYREWQAADIEKKKNCQDCHMPEVTRKVTQATDVTSKILVSMEEEHTLKRHTFGLRKLDEPEEAVSFEVTWGNGEDGCFAEVAAINNLPHFIPTGDFGFRRGILTLTAKSAEGKIVSQESIDLFKEIRTALKPGERRLIRFSVPVEADRLEVALAREGQNEANPFVVSEHIFNKNETGG